MLYWPRGLVSAGAIGWKLATPSSDPGANLAGQPQGLFLSGGPCWSLGLDSLVMLGRDPILAGQALRAALGNGSRPITIATCDCRLAPLAAGLSFGVTPNTDGSPFDDFQAGEENPIVAEFDGAYSLRATTVGLTLTTGADPSKMEGAEFGVTNATWGQRKHRIIRDNGDGTYHIRPGLREAVTEAQAVDFNRPACVMRLAGPFTMDGQAGRLRTGQVAFVEYPGPVS